MQIIRIFEYLHIPQFYLNEITLPLNKLTLNWNIQPGPLTSQQNMQILFRFFSWNFSLKKSDDKETNRWRSMFQPKWTHHARSRVRCRCLRNKQKRSFFHLFFIRLQINKQCASIFHVFSFPSACYWSLTACSAGHENWTREKMFHSITADIKMAG